MPIWQRSAGSVPVTVLPAKRICPRSGASSPLIMPNRLVLPAPFGPTTPTASPSSTEMRQLLGDDDLPEPLGNANQLEQGRHAA